MTTSDYQFLPPLLPDEFEALKTSIAERGVDVPIIVDQQDSTIDGYHRERACDELGIFCPREVRHFDNEADKLELILRLNCRRRQLNRKQKRSVIEAYLLRDPQIADNFLAEIIGGISKNTVAAVRGELEGTCQIDKFDVLRGRDGKQRPVQYKKIVANTAKEVDAAMKAIGDLPDNCAGKTLDVISAKRRARRAKGEIQRGGQRKAALSDIADIRLHHCRFQELDSVAEIAPESVQLVCTDIPYGKEFLPQVEELGQFARQVLVDGGLLVTYSGQYWLPSVINLLGRSLTYRWTRATFWDGDATTVHIGGQVNLQARVLSKWKPIVVMSKGDMTGRRQWHDVNHVVSKEKYWHPWQQPLPEVTRLIEDFSLPGDQVIDPCGGGFTTAIACLHTNRRFIGCDVEEKNVAAGQERLRLNKELYIHLTDADDLARPLTDGKVFDDWKRWEGVSDELAGHILRDQPDEVRRLLDNGLPPAA